MINRITFFLGIFLSFSLVFMISCDSATNEKEIKIQLTGDVHEHVYLDKFLVLLKDKNNVLYDIRTLGEFAYGHIAGAKSLPVNSPDFVAKIRALDDSKTYLLYGDAGPRATSAMRQMDVVGIKRLFNLRRGVKAWTEAGRAVVKE